MAEMKVDLAAGGVANSLGDGNTHPSLLEKMTNELASETNKKSSKVQTKSSSKEVVTPKKPAQKVHNKTFPLVPTSNTITTQNYMSI